MNIILGVVYVLVAAAIVLRVFPNLWLANARFSKGIAVVVVGLVFMAGLGFAFSFPETIQNILLYRIIPSLLMSALLIAYALLERRWDQEFREEVEKQITG